MGQPVSVIMPVRNEERHLAAAVAAVLAQDYPDGMEVVLAIGPSSDGTERIASGLAAADPRVLTVANPTGRTPDALNAAIAASTHDIIVRVDAHSELSPGYIARAVETLVRTGADNVGGTMAATGTTPFECAVAAAMRSPLGVGAARFHTGGVEGAADTVYLGVFRRSAIARVGGYDPHFTRAQDWEMNYRIRASGGTVWYDPALVVTYRPRGSVGALARQYFEYGAWRREVMRTHRPTRSQLLRYLAPPVAVAGTLAGAALAAAGQAWGLALPVGYLAIEAIASLSLRRSAGAGARWVPIVLVVMHWSWGTGFLTSGRKR